MRHRLSTASAVTFTAFLAAAQAVAVGPVVRDQSNLSDINGYRISSFVPASDFTISGPVRLTSAEVWLDDGEFGDNGVLDSFSGVLSWAIYANSAGAPGAIVEHGKAVGLVQRDALLQDEFDDDIFAVRFELDPPVSLAAGTYWFALHEGTWGSDTDGSDLFWAISSSVVGAATRSSDDEANPGSWSAGTTDCTFVLFGTTPAWDQSPVVYGAPYNSIGDFVTANSFDLPSAGSFSSFEAWLVDGLVNDNGSLDTFSGALSWAVYPDSKGTPGTEITHGDGSNIRIYETDLQSSSESDLMRVRVALNGSVSLAGGDYWFALHEGAWGQLYDASELWWADANVASGPGSWSDSDETSPGAWGVGQPERGAFVLFNEVIFASGFESGVFCGWGSSPNLDCI